MIDFRRAARWGVAKLIRLATGIVGRPPPVPAGAQAIYFANHSSHLDFLSIWAALPDAYRTATSPVAAADYWGAPAWRRRLAEDVFQAVLIARRERPTKEDNPMERMARVLESGRSLLIFPEGTRGNGEAVAAFKPGLYHLARRFPGAVLVPTYLENLNRILPKGRLLPVPIIGRLEFREPVELGEDEDKAAFLERARTAVTGGHGPISPTDIG